MVTEVVYYARRAVFRLLDVTVTFEPNVWLHSHGVFTIRMASYSTPATKGFHKILD